MSSQHSLASKHFSRRKALLAISLSLFTPPLHARADTVAAQAGTEEHFNFLSANGNSNCSTQFRDSIATLPATVRVQGSCCGPMSLHRYKEQVEALKEFVGFPEIPPDPYDIDSALAARLMGEYRTELNRVNLARYNAAMDIAEEGGPCCCKCWRWEVLGGMGKVLIRDRQVDSKTLARIWDLTNGCGGDSHVH